MHFLAKKETTRKLTELRIHGTGTSSLLCLEQLGLYVR